jgi:hypothetical protein
MCLILKITVIYLMINYRKKYLIDYIEIVNIILK